MKAFLLYRDRDFDPEQKLPRNQAALTQDLELDTLFSAMALGDKYLFEVARRVVLSGLDNDLDTIRYRQDLLKDCLRNPSIVQDIYAIAVEAIESEKKHYWGLLSKYPTAILDRSVEVLQMFVEMLKKLRAVADGHSVKFESEGFGSFFAMLQRELDDEYFASVQEQLRTLKYRDGVLVSAELGEGNKGTHYVLRKLQGNRPSWIERLLNEWVLKSKPSAYTLYVADRDEAGFRALGELRDRGINLVANALAQSNDHILSFFSMLRTELAFYIGCLNLHGQLIEIGEPVSFPLPEAPCELQHSFKGLYDASLALTIGHKIVGNDITADQKNLVLVTGANQGGKSTFLRSIGLAQLMMQCGMFVPAESFRANICDRLFTHYKREEDVTMNSGKLDEELSRMSDVVDQLSPHSLLLFNESFAATNDREGSEIARQVVLALLDKPVKIFFVTHLYEFARGFHNKRIEHTLFLRAERQPDGTRTFKLVEGEPLQTSFGKDLYDRIFTDDHVG